MDSVPQPQLAVIYYGRAPQTTGGSLAIVETVERGFKDHFHPQQEHLDHADVYIVLTDHPGSKRAESLVHAFPSRCLISVSYEPLLDENAALYDGVTKLKRSVAAKGTQYKAVIVLTDECAGLVLQPPLPDLSRHDIVYFFKDTKRPCFVASPQATAALFSSPDGSSPPALSRTVLSTARFEDLGVKLPDPQCVQILSDEYRRLVYNFGLVPGEEQTMHGWQNEGFIEVMQRAVNGLKTSGGERVVTIELGTWMGYSANTTAQLLKQAGVQGARVITVDTWLGSSEHYTIMADGAMQRLDRLRGYPRMYHAFLSNTLALENDDIIVPLPLPTTQAAHVLQHQGIAADIIYVDAAHDEQSVYADIDAYWPLLKPGGIMIGDDWKWEGVAKAAKRFFVEERGLELKDQGGVWHVAKP